MKELTSAIPVQRSNQSSYQANWELVIKLVRYQYPGKMKMKLWIYEIHLSRVYYEPI